MNVICVTQGSSLNIFYPLIEEIKNKLNIEKVAYYVTDENYFNKFSKENKNINNFEILKEWEIVNDSKKTLIKEDVLAEYERKIGDPSLWSSVICDRRIYNGQYTKVIQHYKPRYNHLQIKKILQTALIEIDDLFNRIKPDLILSFVPVTFGDYLFYSFSKYHNVKYYHLKSTKFNNYVMWSPNIFENPIHVYNRYSGLQSQEIKSNNKELAMSYYKSCISNRVIYEGNFIDKADTFFSSFKRKIFGVPYNLFKKLCKQVLRGAGAHQSPNLFYNQIYKDVVVPLNKTKLKYLLKKYYVSTKELENIEFVFYPLHHEPEIALSVYGKYYLNQIEFLRNVAQNLPINMKIIVKEHPRTIGQRKKSYYKKLLEIPNLMLIDPGVSPKIIMKYSSAVLVVSGFLGFEAIMNKRPVITVGFCPFNVLPDNMVKYVDNIKDVGRVIVDLIHSYSFNEKALINYITATIDMSVPVNIYTEVLKKPGRYAPNKGNKKKNFIMLGELLIENLKNNDCVN